MSKTPDGCVPFTQYLRPNGRPVEVWIDRSPEIGQLARECRAAGCLFELEELMNGVVSATVERIDEEGEPRTLSHVLVKNGPDVPSKIDALVREAHSRLDLAREGTLEDA